MPDMNIFAYTLTNIVGFRDNKKQYKTKPKKKTASQMGWQKLMQTNLITVLTIRILYITCKNIPEPTVCCIVQR